MPALRDRKDDINLLFRKFASDFSAKYGMSKVSLTEDASIMLRRYRWPGNIRQLKNVAEAVSALESGRISPGSDKCVIDMDVLARYIPKEEPNLLPAKSSSYQDSPESAGEREAIIRMLLQLKQDVDYLKDVVAKAGLGRGSVPAISAPEEMQMPPVHDMTDIEDDPEEQDFQESEPEDMSIRTASLELIEKVLRKHGGNRKAAAAELGISERTLYRKIKQMTDK
jgi:DNA-binding NtrC family response regulator